MSLKSDKGTEAAGSVYGSSGDSEGGGLEEGMQATDYGSILYQLREAEDEAPDLLHFLNRCLEVFWDSLAVTAVLILLIIMPIAMLAVGSSYQHECPREPRTPIYLQVGGAFGCLLIVLLLWQQHNSRRIKDMDNDDDDDLDSGMLARGCRFTSYMVSLFLLAWFLMGNVWVWGVWKPNFRQPLHEPQNWCNQVLYLFSVYHLLLVYALLALALIVFCCTVLVYGARRGCNGR